ncbi:MAG: hypothetical protein ACRYFZ_09615 [Janthinobacterium lividum]
MNQPQNFLNAPQPGGYHPPATPPSQTEEVRARYVSRLEPRLTVRADGSVHLNAEAARLLPDGDGTIDLRPPIRERDSWHLDCRAGGHYRRLNVGTSGGIRFKAAARTNAMLGIGVEELRFGLERVGNDLFRLYTESVNK